jgi:hypothetical protein
MRLVFPGIKAESPEAAARLASAGETEAPERVEDCEGLAYVALVDRDGDDHHDESETVRLRADGGEIEPAPTTVTNAHRAKWAEAAVNVYLQHTRCQHEDSLGDLLCDLMHWSHREGFDFDLALSRAKGQFEDEHFDEEAVAVTLAAPALHDALLDIKRLARKHDDAGFDPHTLLEMIEGKAVSALATVKGGAA